MMTETDNTKEDVRESIFLNEKFMMATCLFAAITSLIAFILMLSRNDYFARFEVLVKLMIVTALYLSFRHYNWDVAKGLMGGVLFCLMYREAYLVLGNLWAEEDFDTYLVVGVQGSIYLASAGMSFLMTIIITINHFIINYAKHGNPGNVILNRMAILFKLVVYVILIVTNSVLGFSPILLWENSLLYLSDMAVLLLLVCIESQFDSFKILRQELMQAKWERRMRS